MNVVSLQPYFGKVELEPKISIHVVITVPVVIVNEISVNEKRDNDLVKC